MTAFMATPRTAPTNRWTPVLALIAVVTVGVMLALLPAPMPIRTLVALPALTLVAGYAATRLALGRRTAGDGPLPAGLTVVFALLSLLAAMLVLTVLRIPLDTESIAVCAGVGAVALVLLAGSPIGSPDSLAPGPMSPSPVPRRLLPRLRPALGLVAAVAVLAAAVGAAVALQPTVVERYSQIALADPLFRTGEPVPARVNGPVSLGFTLRTYGFTLAGPAPTVDVSVGGDPVAAEVAAPVNADPAGATAAQDRTLTFTAPRQEGLYPVRIAVTPRDTGDSAPAVLVVLMRVTS